jgi:hypothetical protein
LLVSLLLCALPLEAVSRFLFQAPPSVVVENLSDREATARPLMESENVGVLLCGVFSC